MFVAFGAVAQVLQLLPQGGSGDDPHLACVPQRFNESGRISLGIAGKQGGAAQAKLVNVFLYQGGGCAHGKAMSLLDSAGDQAVQDLDICFGAGSNAESVRDRRFDGSFYNFLLLLW
jgi:hypothetical protein